MKYSAAVALFMLSLDANAKGFFAGYDFGEMAFNDFKKFSGEVGYKFESGRSIKLFHMDLMATEEHLSSEFAQSVDGDNVTGVIRGFEIFYNFPLSGGWYFGSSVGYYTEKFQHTHLLESVSSTSPTVGVALGYREENLFGFSNLYYDFSIPVRYTFNGFKETKLGDSTVKNNTIANNIWFVLGYNF